MLSQLHFDFKKLVYQKRYLMILTGILLFSIIYAVYLSHGGLPMFEVVDSGLSQFRPVYWLICCYMVCDVISSDYHSKTLKTTIPYAKSRTSYIASKSILSAGICFFALLVHLLSSFTAACIFSPNSEWMGWGQSFVLASIGAISTILFFVSIFIFCMIVTENEAVTIGFAMGTVIIMLILESIKQISTYVPTMQVITLQATVNANFSTGILIVGALVFLAIAFSLFTTSIFRRKDLFV
ncbi:hypothetical protein [Paenibacillus donghaensis]|uniref:Uncharacterized protein n=1 Tax=Paenibacillus donghaensis TaxID=414771 RepID=A0A2Z2KGS9_9BACL|nr:hypothetical protein [Paenibacillus donghaensis]ASA20032.1 hypothetical protein B9T62_03990 [Paenibacillus donghaensis]